MCFNIFYWTCYIELKSSINVKLYLYSYQQKTSW